MEPKTQQNGARAKILRALANADCGLTTAELAESAGLTAGQVRDNAGVAKKAGLLTIEQDEMTRFVTYHIAQKGREWLSAGNDDAQAVADTGQDGEDHQSHCAPEDRARWPPRQLAFVRATRPTWFRGPIRQQTKALLQI
ncbi:MAG: helix-turn-helix transcriptional regulator [Saprospiraceae bacterium]|nr:helix-turn-helix transcriptional regulator [Candidatus Vicinibacter affinis]